jgi:HAD superfamily hydrolase (TIGR01509 family)
LGIRLAETAQQGYGGHRIGHKPLLDNDMDKHGRKFEAIVFDMDGVLIDSEPVHYESTRILFEDEFGIPFPESANTEFLGSTDRYMFETLKARHQLEPPLEEIITRRKRLYMELLIRDGLPWRDGIRELISDLANSGYRLAVATSGLTRIVEPTLNAGQIRHLFEAVVTGDDIHTPKPAPDIYLEAARRLAVDPSVCVAIEDTDVGVRAAKSAGMWVIAFPNSTTRGMDFGPADFVAGTSGEIRGRLL